eukprot:CAMPEP_0119114228 /NCGR_PEP_ID=MMETSP1180-20130426/46683_1 /TAXON_ID=3052 ORGANISM="Chlamydomonas cf sp, Strain CCMP681" /NCGR_SAMPLE_ID=MMETSP1180 /ASSEMBLY_ACC=CAM_ASM_000741 /LENGTH=131 /DNA_ID=CAMNT_0007102665 /DNA_START=62 /DNA_END=453 /DNA_ORIENTATION=-
MTARCLASGPHPKQALPAAASGLNTAQGNMSAGSSSHYSTEAVHAGLISRPSKERFYKTVHVREVLLKPGEAGDAAKPSFQVYLDTRTVRTPGQRMLSLPSRALALAIAAEWEWQGSGRPQMLSMPLMSLA